MKVCILILVLSLILIITLNTNAQSCNSSIGDPVLNETFGSGTSVYGPPLAYGITNLIYQTKDCPEDGYYSIRSLTSNCYDWATTRDHTGNPNGYFMLINASCDPSDFYVKTVSGLCGGNNYKFSAWIINLATKPEKIKPNVTFTIEQTDGKILATYTTGDIPTVSKEEWHNFSFYFNTPIGITDVVLRMRNNAPGGNGNDLGLDDIVFQTVGPSITPTIEGVSGKAISLCKSKIPTKLTLSSKVESCYNPTDYQWQQSADKGITWTDILGATDTFFSYTANTAGNFQFRLSVAQKGNMSSLTCRVHSAPLNINVTEPDSIITKDICEGDSFLTYNKTGIYVNSFVNINGCDSLRTLNLNVLKAPKGTDSIAGKTILCKGTSTQLKDATTDGVWKSTNQNVATINGAGLVTAVEAGKTSIHYVVTNMCGADSSIKTVNVYGTQLVYKVAVPHDPTCFYPFSGKISVVATGSEKPYSFLWGDSIYTAPYNIGGVGEGDYKIYIRNNIGCLVDSFPSVKVKLKDDGSCDTLYVPNGFTPTSLKGNNLLKPFGGAATIKDIKFKVFNRYGNLMFESNNVYDGWDGRINGTLQNSGVYLWYLEYTVMSGMRKHAKGTCLLIQ